MKQLLPGITRAVEAAKKTKPATRNSDKGTEYGAVKEEEKHVCVWVCWIFQCWYTSLRLLHYKETVDLHAL
jgi:hypothetical protein